MNTRHPITRVKICGITTVEDAFSAAEAGADLLGMIFYPKSPRYVTPERAADIVRAVRRTMGTSAPRCVGVFVNESVASVRAVLRQVRLDLAQLHGDEPPEVVGQLQPRAFKAIRPATSAEATAQAGVFAPRVSGDSNIPQLLVDAYHPRHYGGTGIVVDLDMACGLSRSFRILLAGGLTPETVGPIVEQVRPWGVDVSSGVERIKGRKDRVRVAAFVAAVRATDAALDVSPSEPIG
jgi:phosphoribosylanthranilate isomerase